MSDHPNNIVDLNEPTEIQPFDILIRKQANGTYSLWCCKARKGTLGYKVFVHNAKSMEGALRSFNFYLYDKNCENKLKEEKRRKQERRQEREAAGKKWWQL